MTVATQPFLECQAMPFGHGHMGGPFVNGPDAGSPLWLHDLFVLLFIVALVAGAIILVRILAHRPPRPVAAAPYASPALSELEVRYARGELSRDDYLQRRFDLLSPPAPPMAAPAAPAATPAVEKPAKPESGKGS